MSMMNIVLTGPGRVPAMLDPSGPVPWLVKVVPYFIVAVVIVGMVVSILLRYSERFREFWETHICSFMEEHQVKEEK